MRASSRAIFMLAVLLPALAFTGCAGVAAHVGGPAAPSPANTSALALSTGATGSSSRASRCRPVLVLPFECGTYRSVFGVKSVTGDTGGPAVDRLTLTFLPSDTGLVLAAVGSKCFNAVLPVTVRGTRLVRTGAARYDQGACHGRGTDKHDWAYGFLNGPLELDTGGGGLVFNARTAMVTFEYEGAAPLGQKQIPRNDPACVADHIAPFGCGGYTSTGGTGALAFLSSHPYRLDFEHINGELTATLDGTCNAFSPVLEVDGRTVLAIPGATTLMGCGGPDGTRDDALTRFFDGVLAYRVNGDVLTFSSPSSSAVFRQHASKASP